MLDIVVISGEDVCCSVMFDTLVGVFLYSEGDARDECGERCRWSV